MQNLKLRRHTFKRNQKPPSMRLQDRDLEILRLVADYGVLSSAHIYALLGTSTSGATRRVQERLSRLFHNGYLHRPPQQITLNVYQQVFNSQYGALNSGSHLIYTITQQGADMAFLDDPERRQQISWQTQAYKRQFLNLWHALMVAEFHATIAQVDYEKTKTQLRSWKQGEDINQHPPQVKIKGKKGSIKKAIKPDAYFILKKGEYVQHFFLEADRSTMTIARFVEKIKAYWKLWQEKKHAEHFGIGESVGFRVLTTTISEARAENLRRAVKEADNGKIGNNMFYFTCAKNIDFTNPESILKPIWRTPAGDEYRGIG
ncbi:MAG: replication-relaxation family protein [bacterium]